MKKMLGKLGFKKADEMERSIQLKAIRIAWVYTVLFLIVWSLWESHQANLLNERVNMIPSGLLVSQNLILILTQLFFRYRMSGGEDETSKNPFVQTILVGAIILVIGGTLALITAFIIR